MRLGLAAVLLWQGQHGAALYTLAAAQRLAQVPQNKQETTKLPSHCSPLPTPRCVERSGHTRLDICLQVLHPPPAQQEPDQKGGGQIRLLDGGECLLLTYSPVGWYAGWGVPTCSSVGGKQSTPSVPLPPRRSTWRCRPRLWSGSGPLPVSLGRRP